MTAGKDSVMAEELTDEERADLENHIDALEKQAKELASALEEAIQKTDEELKAIQLAQAIIDAHNELVGKHADARRKYAERVVAAEAQVAELTRERDIAEIHERELRALQLEHESEVTRLTRERDEALKLAVDGTGHITRLTEALAAAERQLEAFGESTMRLLQRAEAAEARVRELEADLVAQVRIQKGADEQAEFHLRNSDAEYDRRRQAEQQLAAANTLLLEPNWRSWMHLEWLDWEERRQAHLSSQPAAPTDHDRAVLEAMRNIPMPTLLQCSAMNGTIRGISTSLADAGAAELARREARPWLAHSWPPVVLELLNALSQAEDVLSDASPPIAARVRSTLAKHGR